MIIVNKVSSTVLSLCKSRMKTQSEHFSLLGSDGDECSKNGKKTTETMTLRKEGMDSSFSALFTSSVFGSLKNVHKLPTV